jgi:acyl carrier protein
MKDRSPSDIRTEVLDLLADHAARADLRERTDDVLLRDCGLDSFGTFEFMLALEHRLALGIPDHLFDARRCRSVDGIVEIVLDAQQSAGDARPGM